MSWVIPPGISKGLDFVTLTESDSVDKFESSHIIDGVEVNVKKISKPTPRKDGNCEIHVLFPSGTKMDKDMISMNFF